MPSHLREPKKAHLLREFLDNGGSQEWIDGNDHADKLAEKGAASQAPPRHLMLRERFKVLLARAAQRMYAHVWAIHREYLPDPENSSTRYIPDEAFGMEDPWAEIWDPHDDLVPEEAWQDGMFDCHHDDYEEGGFCNMDDPDEVFESSAEQNRDDNSQRGQSSEYTLGGKQVAKERHGTEVAGGMGLPGRPGGEGEGCANIRPNDDEENGKEKEIIIMGIGDLYTLATCASITVFLGAQNPFKR
jgi:hypothetical protein